MLPSKRTCSITHQPQVLPELRGVNTIVLLFSSLTAALSVLLAIMWMVLANQRALRIEQLKGEVETNLVTCKIAHDVFNIPSTIARLRGSEFKVGDPLLSSDRGFSVDEVICPEESLTRYIRKLIEYPEALQVLGRFTRLCRRGRPAAPTQELRCSAGRSAPRRSRRGA